MQFPRFKNLGEMLNEFGQRIIPNIKESEIQTIERININSNDNTEKIDFASIMNNNHDYYMKYIEFILEKDDYNNINKSKFNTTCVNGFQKRIQICKNLFEIYLKNQKGIADVVDGKSIYNRIIEKISYSDNIYVSSLPIFSYLDKGYSITEMLFDNINYLMEFIGSRLICIYEFYVYDDYSICLKYCELDYINIKK